MSPARNGPVTMFKKILVPLDGSKTAEGALPYALDLAQRGGGHLMLARVCSATLSGGSMAGYPVPGTALETELVLAQQHVEEYLRALRFQVEGVQVSTHAPQGTAVAALVALIEEQQVSLIVMTSHGRSGLTRFVLGSVAEKLMRLAPCPVFIVGRDDVQK